MTAGSTRNLAGLAAGAKRGVARLARTVRSRIEDMSWTPDDTPPAPLFIHFGTHKTGSSSIQSTLYENSGRRFGYDYPDLGVANGSLPLSICFADLETLKNRRLVSTVEVAAERREVILARLAKLMSSAPRGLPKVLSGEVIAHFKPDELQALDAFVSALWADRVYIGYFREPVSYCRSAFQESLKQTLPVNAVIDPRTQPSALALRSHHTVEVLDRLAGRDRVRAFAFDPASFPEGDVVRHFLREIGLRDTGIPVVRSNESLSLLAVKLLYLYRSRKAKHDRDHAHPKSRPAFLGTVADLGSQRFDLHPELAARVVAANREYMEWSHQRLDRPLVASEGANEAGISSPADLESLSRDEIAAFQDRLALYGMSLPANPGPDEIAEAMHQLRLAAADGVILPSAGVAPSTLRQGAAPHKPGPVLRRVSDKRLLYLHIGMGKTGTTTIQEFCWSNRRQFAAAGVIYPELGIQSGAHHRLSPHVPNFLPKTWEFLAPEDWAPKLAAGAPGTLLLSSEIMSSADDKATARLAAALLQEFDVRVLVYVRRIDDSIMSNFNQNVKAGTQRLAIEDALPNLYERLRADKILTRWMDAFGPANVIVRPYESEQFLAGDLLADFCATLRLPWSDKFVRPVGNPNARLGRPALEFKRCVNVAVPNVAISKEFNASLLEYSVKQDALTHVAFQDADLLPGAVRRQLVAMQDDFYRAVAKSQPGLNGETLFVSPLPVDDLAWTPLALSPEAFTEVGRAVLTRELKGILRQQIAEARASKDPQRLAYAARFAELV